MGGESAWRGEEKKEKEKMLPSSAEGGETLRAWKFGKEREGERGKTVWIGLVGRKTFPSEILSGFYEVLRPPFIFIAPCYGMKSSAFFIAPTYFWTVED